MQKKVPIIKCVDKLKMMMNTLLVSPQLKTTFSTDSRVQNMFDILLSDEMEKDKREKVLSH